MQICKKCGGVAAWDGYFSGIVCTRCGHIEREKKPVSQHAVKASFVETREVIENHPTWYRKHLCCSECGTEIRSESWNESRCFGAGTILKDNTVPNFCPVCGSDLREVDYAYKTVR